MESKVMKKVTKLTRQESKQMPLEYMISTLNQYFDIYFNNNLKEYNVNRSQTTLLLQLSKKDNVTQEYLSKLLDVQEGTITNTLKKLEKKQLIKRQPDSKDRRKKIVTITEEGLKIAEIYRKLNHEIEKEIKLSITENDIENLKITITEVAKIISEKNRELKK